MKSEFINVAELRVGHFVFIDLGWMSHPFPLNNFRIQTEDQLRTIRSLGIERIRYSPESSDPALITPDRESANTAGSGYAEQIETEAMAAARRRRAELSEQRASLRECERQFNEAVAAFRNVSQTVHSRPLEANHAVNALVQGFIASLDAEREPWIRLLSEKACDRLSLHALNVTVISLLLGKFCGLDGGTLQELGAGALVHDLGKMDLPAHLRFQKENPTAAEMRMYQEHVPLGIAIGQKMELARNSLLVIAQHHEQADGRGYPMRITNERMLQASRIVSLVNSYDNLCNPERLAQALTPHEAVSHLYAHGKQRFDPATLTAFIRMMGVYPPGSVVQLTDERFALVVSAKASRPLKPRVIIHEPGVGKDEALVVDLEYEPQLGIRRSIKPLQLPKAALDYLSPRERNTYFFEHARTEELGAIA